MINLDGVIDRVKKKAKISQGKDVANLLGLSSADFSNRKRRGTLLPLIIEWGLNERVNLHWLVTGEETLSWKGAIDEDPEVASLLEGAKRVLKSGNPVAFDALERNIRYFDHAVATEKRLQIMESQMKKIMSVLDNKGEMLELEDKEELLKKTGTDH